MVKSLDPPILIFPTLPKRKPTRFQKLAQWQPRSNWPEYCLFVTILVCLPVNLWFWGRSPEAAAAPKVTIDGLATLTSKIIPAVGAPGEAKLASIKSPIAVAQASSPPSANLTTPAVLPPALGPTAKANPPAPVLTVKPGFSGNSYSYGQCTWYVASKRSIPGHWGNAKYWYGNAQAAGFKVGLSPAINAIAWTSVGWAGHVALVEDVDGDRVLVSEMNNSGVRGGGWNRVDRRWANASEFKYIY